ncbi:MAG: family 20 glycosylhydrolase, partial [Lentisphaeria bacterium]|nr:family 20 glycosylhydrolase [Lentisphaeria bacterium]
MKKNDLLRIAQLDLARQMETVAFIRNFIDLIAQFHYNALFLYVEWRVRTKTFDIGSEEGYSTEELKEIISYAAEKKITVIPGFATLGHAELLLKTEKFAHLSELREGIEGRFGKTFSPDFCPSLPETRDFLAGYLEEAAEIFSSSPYFHVGGDEVWDLGFCSKCKEKAKDFAGEQKLYLDHFLFIYGLLKKMGKKMMFWDDMFEYYPELLKQMPKDIMMINWQYHDNVKGYSGHLRNMYFEDRLAKYDQLGFRYIPAPADYSWYNIASITEYGRKYNCAGFMLTAWEKQPSLMYKYFINTAMAGEFWKDLSASADDAGKKALEKLFGIKDGCFTDAVLAYAGIARRIPNVSMNSLTSFPLSGPGNTRYYLLKALYGELKKFEVKMKDERGNLILKDILFDCRLKILEDRSVRAAWRMWQNMEYENISSLCKEVEEAGKEYAFFYTQHRRKKDSLTFRNMIS